MARDVVAILGCTDPEATVGWYRAAGFEVRQIGPLLHEVTRGDLILHFLGGATPWPGPPALTGCFYVHVPDVDAVAAQVSGTIEAEWGVEDRDWGARELVLRDPDGYHITFTTA